MHLTLNFVLLLFILISGVVASGKVVWNQNQPVAIFQSVSIANNQYVSTADGYNFQQAADIEVFNNQISENRSCSKLMGMEIQYGVIAQLMLTFQEQGIFFNLVNVLEIATQSLHFPFSLINPAQVNIIFCLILSFCFLH